MIDLLKGKLVGVSSSLIKPFNVESILLVVKTYLGVAVLE
jgi:hypothetical protein